MSSELQHKMYNYEVAPPDGAWDKIIIALDDSHLANKFPAALYNTAINPPAGAWEGIAATLGELHLADQFPATLYNLEAAPPASAWGKIQASLEEKEEETAIAGRRGIPLFIRYAAAAILIGVIAFGALTFFNNKEDKTGLAEGKTVIPAQDNKTNTPGNIETNTSTSGIAEQTSDQDARDEAALQNSKHTYAVLSISDKRRIKAIGEDFFSAPASTIRSAQGIGPEHMYRDLECSDVQNALYTSGNSSIDMASRYAMLMTPDGHIIRISKKLGSLVCCVSGEEQDDNCKDQLKKWRQKIADSPVAPSPGNFMDILNLLHSLKDNNL